MLSILSIYNKPEALNGILHSGTLNNMWTTRQVAPQNKNISIGLGWWITESEKYGRYFWHVGNNPGYSAILIVFPEHSFGITVMSNGMYAEQIVWNKIPFDIIGLIGME